MKSVFVHVFLIFLSVATVFAQPVGAKVSRKPLVKISPAQRAKLDKKIRKMTAFDQPEEAMAFYANSRTGPITTRAGNITTDRPLDPVRYLDAAQALRSMPRFDSATGSVLPPDAGRGADQIEPLATAASPGAALGSWISLGPANQGGRTRSLLIDPINPNIMYAGGVDGGVWKSTDAGSSWSTNTDLALANLAVVTLAFQPNNSAVLYAGTGEGFGNIDAIRGAGIFKSLDSGVTWTQLSSTNNANFHYVSKILVSPRNPQRVWAATRTGVWRSLDGGSTWANSLLPNSPANGCTDMAMQMVRSPGFIFASCGAGGTQGTIWRAIDADASSWSSVLAQAGQGRSAIAIAPSNEAIVYVMSAQRDAGAGPGQYGLHGVYRSASDGSAGSFTTQRAGNTAFGNTADKINKLLLSNPILALLSECGLGTSRFSNQGWYDNVLAVDPLDADRVWAGGIDVWRSDNAGIDWGVATYWWFVKGQDQQYAHADQHAFAFHPNYNGTTNKILFVGNDGGIQRINDARAPVNTTLAQLCGLPVLGSPTVTDRNNGYVTTQFYHGSVYPDGTRLFGGLQDNGTMRGATASLNWSVLAGGDGGYTALDTKNNGDPADDVLFLTNTENSLKKSINGGTSFAAANVGITGTGFLFIAPFEMNPGNRNHIWTGGTDIWFSANQAATWTRMTGVGATCGNGSISAIAAHPADGNRVLIGMSDGCYHYSTTATVPVSGSWAGGSQIANGFLSSIAWDPNNLEVAYATVSNFTSNTLLKTVDHGISWAPTMGVGSTALPQIPARTVVVNPAASNEVYVGTDLGVFVSTNGGVSWYREAMGFANVSINSLRISSSAPYRLFAFTHGRGAWSTPLATNAPRYTLGSNSASVASSAGTGSVSLSTMPGDASWTANSNAGWLSVTPTSGVGSASLTFTFTANVGTSARLAILTIGGQTFTVTQAGLSPSQPISVSPSSGSTGRQVFSFVSRHTSTANSILYSQVLFSKNGLNAANGCYISYDPAGNVFYLLSDDVSTWYGLLGGSPNKVGNSQCTIHGATSGSSKSGTDLTITIDVSFRTSFGGTKAVYLLAGDSGGAVSSWQQVGTRSDTGDTQVVELISLSPGSGSGGSVTFTSVVKDSDGATTIPFTQFVMNAGLNGFNACFIHYDRASNAFFLLKDDASGWFGLLGGTAGQVANSQCVLRGTGSGGTASGDTLTVTYNLQFKSGFTGSRQIYLQAVDNTGVIQSWKQMGTWTVSGTTISSAASPAGGRLGVAEPSGPVFEGPRRYRVTRQGDVFLVGAEEGEDAFPGLKLQLRRDRGVRQ